MYMNDIKLFAKKLKRLEPQMQTIWIYSQDIEMEFDIGKCAMLIAKSWKRQIKEDIERQIKKKIRTLGSGHHHTNGDKRKKTEKEYLKRTRKPFKTKLSRKSLIKAIKFWAVALIKFSEDS